MTAIAVGGHSPGQLITIVGSDDGDVVLASDAVHFYEELEFERPFSVVGDLVDMYAAYDVLKELARGGRQGRPGPRPGGRPALSAGAGGRRGRGGSSRMRGAGEMTSGIIGLGNMGGRIARRIRDEGLPVWATTSNPSRRRWPGSSSRTRSPRSPRSGVVLLSLPDSTAVEQVVLGDDGLLANARARQVVVDLTTAAPSSSVKIHAALARRGVAFVDAGISGGAAAAEQGTLTIMAGGAREALEIVAPILATFSARVYHMGEPGSGHVAKLLNNFLNATSLAATAEVMVAAKQSGLDLAQFLDVVNHSSGVNFATLNRFPRIIEGDYLEGGLSNALMAKDVRLYLEHVQEIGTPSLTGAACLGVFELAGALGYGDQISNRVVDAIGDIAGGVRVQQEARTNQ